MNLLAIIGHPAGHSLSPLMFNTASKALGLDFQYEAIDVEPADLKREIEALVKRGCRGFNVTIPHKQSVIPLLHTVDEEAKAIGAVNAVKVDDGQLSGFNTDVDGVWKTLEPYRTRIEGKRVALLGAGGAARAVLYCLVKELGPAHVTVMVRSEERGKELASALGGGVPTSVFTMTDKNFSTIIGESALFVNATPVGMNSSDSPLPTTVAFHREQIVFDLIYTPSQTTLLRTAASQGATTIGGLEMLVQQGARAFELFTGKQMPVELVRRTLEQELKDRNK